MFDWIKYRYCLWKLLRSKRETQGSYSKTIKKAKSEEEKRKTSSEAGFFIAEEELKIRELQTARLRYIAKRLMVPIPEFKDENLWKKDRCLNTYILTSRGIYELKKLIRNEKKEKREIVFSWITLLIGLLGAQIGLISMLKELRFLSFH